MDAVEAVVDMTVAGAAVGKDIGTGTEAATSMDVEGTGNEVRTDHIMAIARISGRATLRINSRARTAHINRRIRHTSPISSLGMVDAAAAEAATTHMTAAEGEAVVPEVRPAITARTEAHMATTHMIIRGVADRHMPSKVMREEVTADAAAVMEAMAEALVAAGGMEGIHPVMEVDHLQLRVTEVQVMVAGVEMEVLMAVMVNSSHTTTPEVGTAATMPAEAAAAVVGGEYV